MENLIQNVTLLLSAVGVLAFFVSIITQVIKEMPFLKQLQTNVVALAVAMIICPVSVLIACQYYKLPIEWYYIFASFIAAFIVYLVSTGGWEKVAEMWQRSKFNKSEKKGR